MTKFQAAARKAVATFLFAGLGQIVAYPILEVDVATWKVGAVTGIGAVLNLVYRWSEAVVHERRSQLR